MSVQDELLTVWAAARLAESERRRSPVALSARPDDRHTAIIPPCGTTPGRCATRSRPSRRRSTAPRRQSRRHRPALRAVHHPAVADQAGGRPAVCPPWSRSTGSGSGAGSTSTFAALILLPIVTFGMAYMIVEVPKPGDIRTNQVSTILASDGSEIAKIVPPEGNRVDVNIDQIPVHVRDAVMAAEDRDFYSNPGFSFTGFAAGCKNNIFGGDTQGGSTITQQYVKNALVGSHDRASAASSARPRSWSSRRRCPANGPKTKCCSRI